MLYLMRHGKTDWNEQHRLQGRTDIPLNENGRAMARQAAAEYASVHFDCCFTSPLARARETAQIVLAGRDVPITIDERLLEMCFGEYEGLAGSFEFPDCPINALFLHPEQYTVSVVGAETFPELFQRTGEFLDEVVAPQMAAGKDILIVGHGTMNNSIISRIRKLPIEDFWSPGLAQCKLIAFEHL